MAGQGEVGFLEFRVNEIGQRAAELYLQKKYPRSSHTVPKTSLYMDVDFVIIAPLRR